MKEELEKWEEEFDMISDVERYAYSPDGQEDVRDSLFGESQYPENVYELSPAKVKRYIKTLLEIKGMNLFEDIVLARKLEREKIIQEIRAMKLWSKGTVEGTVNDIIAKLTPPKQN